MFDVVGEIRAATAGVLTEEEVLDLAPELYEDLEQAVGRAIASRCSAEQLAEFDRLHEATDEAGLHEWFARNSPDRREVVREQFDLLLSKVTSQLGCAARPVEIA
ncbi:DUF5663 domain-containing protein [Ruania rhizosphaerae]|uniref:DUF5663 domain-containing protein n=1 Tax=Ruania rhizosphaerae TaxID=1840413 RepID=UPI00135B662D|nr:DUF5663 domain-containing protein [Ruania rhizosphaerae]